MIQLAKVAVNLLWRLLGNKGLRLERVVQEQQVFLNVFCLAALTDVSHSFHVKLGQVGHVLLRAERNHGGCTKLIWF